MRILFIDPFEFEDPSTEESLKIAIASKKQTDDVKVFVASTPDGAVTRVLPTPRCFSEDIGYGLIRKHLKEFAGIVLPASCAWPTYVLDDSGDEWDVVLESPTQFIRYQWSTSA
jgi:hypothetical protein